MISQPYQLVIDQVVFALLIKLFLQLSFTCSKSTAEIVEQFIRYEQRQTDVVIVSF